MDVYLHDTIRRAWFKNHNEDGGRRVPLRRYDVSESSRFKLGTLCIHGHEALDEHGNGTGFSIRYRAGGGNCIVCNRNAGKRNSYVKRDQIGEKELRCAEARRRIEDIKYANEAGITMEDLNQ